MGNKNQINMRVLWFAGSEGLFSAASEDPYNGVGWVAGLQAAVKMYAENIDIGLAFLTHKKLPFSISKGNCMYYPIYSRKTAWEKVANRFKWNDKDIFYSEYRKAIDDFKPDIIHIFGVEMPYSYFVGCTNMPTVVHLQGFLNPYLNAYFPPGMNGDSFFKYSNYIKEILGLGFNYNYKTFIHNAKKEVKVLSQCKNVMGRTLWDKQIADLMTDNAKYFHVDEALRSVFYDAPKWKYNFKKDVLNIVTTISESTYKGFDLVLKTASLLDKLGIKHQWHVIGVNQRSAFVNLFERQYGKRKERVILHGKVEADGIIDLLLHSDLYVHTSYIDNSPNSVCEAQLLGVPVVACNVGGVSSLIENNKTGFLIPANAPFELAYMIKHYVELPIIDISSNEIEVAEQRHNRKQIIKDLICCYTECVNRGKNG